MEPYQLLKDRYQLKIVKVPFKKNKTIEMDTKSQFFKDLFFTKKEKTNNTIYELILTLIILTIIIGYFSNVTSILGDKIASSSIMSGCSSIFIFIGIVIILAPIFITLERLLVTKIKNIKLVFSSKGLDIIPDTAKNDKKPIFIETLNIAAICVKESEIEESNGRGSYKKRILNIILRLHKPITNPLTNANIEEIILVEELSKDYLTQAVKFSEEIQEALELKDI